MLDLLKNNVHPEHFERSSERVALHLESGASLSDVSLAALRDRGFSLKSCRANTQDVIAVLDQSQVDVILVTVRDGHQAELRKLIRDMRMNHHDDLYVMGIVDPEDPPLNGETLALCDDFLCQSSLDIELGLRLVLARKRIELRECAAEAIARAEQLQVYAAESAALLTHDLNNGLAIAYTNAECLAMADLEDEDMEALDATRIALKRISTLVTNFMEANQGDKHVMTPKLVNCELTQLLGTVLETHKSSRADVTLCFEPGPELEVFLDAPLVERCLHNILNNAFRYASGAKRVELRLQRLDSEHGDWVEICISNSGQSISQPIRERIFERGSNQSDGKVGMGMYFARLACRAHGGDLDLEPGESNTFRMTLPIKPRKRDPK